MQTAQFQLHQVNHRDTIVKPGSGLQVRVYRLESELFAPDPAQVHIYGIDGDLALAFEAAWNEQILHDISAAITWYAQHIDRPGMIISMDEPKLQRRLHLVR